MKKGHETSWAKPSRDENPSAQAMAWASSAWAHHYILDITWSTTQIYGSIFIVDPMIPNLWLWPFPNDLNATDTTVFFFKFVTNEQISVSPKWIQTQDHRRQVFLQWISSPLKQTNANQQVLHFFYCNVLIGWWGFLSNYRGITKV